MISYRRIVSFCMGRTLTSGEAVHHINGNHKDDRVENLMVFVNSGKHTMWHALQKRNDVFTAYMNQLNSYREKDVREKHGIVFYGPDYAKRIKMDLELM